MQAFSDTAVAIVHPHDRDGEELARQLRRVAKRVSHLWPPPDRLPNSFDLLFLAIDERVSPLAATLAEAPSVAVIGVIGAQTGEGRDLLAGAMPHAVLLKPFDAASVMANVAVARSNFSYQRRLHSKVAKLEEVLRSMRKVERAKAILMERQRIDEPTAYAFLRDMAMKKRVPIGLIASTVIDSNEFLRVDKF